MLEDYEWRKKLAFWGGVSFASYTIFYGTCRVANCWIKKRKARKAGSGLAFRFEMPLLEFADLIENDATKSVVCIFLQGVISRAKVNSICLFTVSVFSNTKLVSSGTMVDSRGLHAGYTFLEQKEIGP